MTRGARVELERGLKLFKAGKYADAITAFDAGYEIDPHPDFLYARGQAQRRGGDCRRAIKSYNAFLETEPPASEVALTRQNIKTCEHVLAASREDEDEDKPEAKETATPLPRTIVEVVEVEPARWYTDKLGLTLGAGSLVSFGTAIGFAIAASGNAASSGNANTIQEWVGYRDAWQRDKLVAGVATGIGAAFAIAAGFRLWSVSGDRAVTVATNAGGGTMIVLGGSW
jgi:tetratricopeptide (TPR) repeat protein